MVHIDAMIVWLLFGFIGSVYWLVEEESGVELVGAKLANFNFWIFTTAVVVVVVVFLVVQIGPGNQNSIWFINEGREYIEAPRWADIGIVACMLVFFYNVAGFCDAIRSELARDGVSLTTVFPLLIDTPLLSGADIPPILKQGKRLPPVTVVQKTLSALARRQARVFIPGTVRLVAALHGLAPSLLDWYGRQIGFARSRSA
jgi:hypothetical protein